jgi:hypothetical protein
VVGADTQYPDALRRVLARPGVNAEGVDGARHADDADGASTGPWPILGHQLRHGSAHDATFSTIITAGARTHRPAVSLCGLG